MDILSHPFVIWGGTSLIALVCVYFTTRANIALAARKREDDRDDEIDEKLPRAEFVAQIRSCDMRYNKILVALTAIYTKQGGNPVDIGLG